MCIMSFMCCMWFMCFSPMCDELTQGRLSYLVRRAQNVGLAVRTLFDGSIGRYAKGPHKISWMGRLYCV